MKIFKALNTCFQIYSYASLFVPTDDYRYKSIERRLLKKELGISNVEDHHLIPQSLKSHPKLYDFDVHQCKNIKNDAWSRHNPATRYFKTSPPSKIQQICTAMSRRDKRGTL